MRRYRAAKTNIHAPTVIEPVELVYLGEAKCAALKHKPRQGRHFINRRF
jgi:hypothetical protein